MKRRVTEYWLYKYRYALSYSLAIVLLFIGLAAAMIFVPNGLRGAEMNSAVISGKLVFDNFNPQSVVDLPYHLLQRVSIELFGVGQHSLKLPSLLLGVISVIGMFLLIRAWFRQNIAIITVLITATMPVFLFISQDATPQIFATATAIWLLLCGTYVTRRRAPQLLWKICGGVLLALNMYTPLGIYINIAVLSTIIVHPHIRYLFKRMNPNRIAASGFIAIFVLAPLLYSVAMQPTVGLELLGIPSSKPDIAANSIELIKSYVWQDGSTNGVLHPMFSIGVLMIIVIGFIRFLQVKYTARSYIIWLWGLMLLPILIISPTLAVAALPLAMLMIAMGMNTLIAEWYKLFPYNPYARVLGLIPLSIIVTGVVLSAGTRYTLNYHYNPEIVSQFSYDTRLLKKTLVKADPDKERPIIVVVNPSNLNYYRLVARYDKRFKASVTVPDGKPTPYIMAHDAAKANQSTDIQPSYIAVSDQSHDSDRFYLYTAASK